MEKATRYIQLSLPLHQIRRLELGFGSVNYDRYYLQSLKTGVDLEFARRDQQDGLMDGVYGEVLEIHFRDHVARDRLVPPAVLEWQEESVQRKGRFMINLHMR